MNIERALRGIAGTFVLLSLLLAWSMNGVPLGHLSWLWFTAFIGLNLLQSAFTNWCPMIWFLQRAGMRRERAGA
jgi:Inner membrane protein YgaP-like, transmembrane domain